MIAAIRIKGQVGLNQDVKETLSRLRLRRKYICVVIDNPNDAQMGMIKKMRDFISFGEISKDIYKKLVDARGQKDVEGNLKPFFRLHPPRGGVKTKFHYPQGVLGENKEIENLIERML
ncbi:MAG: uL30 family ribosomal protein [Nanoarchaeota archaeon]|jgi:large subunit ribosomal protein L30|nr:uL30 family ribosomal protein [Nanoarchaeota archaeon]